MIPITKPNIGEEEVQAAAEALRSGWVSQGPRVAVLDHEADPVQGQADPAPGATPARGGKWKTDVREDLSRGIDHRLPRTPNQGFNRLPRRTRGIHNPRLRLQLRQVRHDRVAARQLAASGVTPNDVIIIKNRYKVNEIIYIELANNYFLAERLQIPDSDRVMNLNMMSSNPVICATFTAFSNLLNPEKMTIKLTEF